MHIELMEKWDKQKKENGKVDCLVCQERNCEWKNMFRYPICNECFNKLKSKKV